MTCNTYMLLLMEPKLAVDDRKMAELYTMLHEIPKKDYYITLQYTPLNEISHFVISIIILSRDIKEAKPKADRIEKQLLKSGVLKIERKVTTLIWDEPNMRFALYLN
jgi:ABC-type Mn2+/Zn2+ transport system ATPase subunit